MQLIRLLTQILRQVSCFSCPDGVALIGVAKRPLMGPSGQSPPHQPGGGRGTENCTRPFCELLESLPWDSPLGEPMARGRSRVGVCTPTPRRAMVVSAALWPLPHPCRSAAPFWRLAFTPHPSCALRVVVGGVPRGQMRQLCNVRGKGRLVGGGGFPSQGRSVCRSRGHPVADSGRTAPRQTCCACLLCLRCRAMFRRVAAWA